MTSRKLLFSVTTVTISCVGHADLDALAGDLDAAAGGDPPLHRRGGAGQGGGSGQAHPLQPVAPGGRDGAGQGAPQHAVLGDHVHQLAVQA